MTLERWLGLFFLMISVIYGYTAFIVMDAHLAPFMKFNPVWPSSFPKVLSVIGILVSTVVVVSATKDKEDLESAEINYRRLFDYQLKAALLLLAFMVLYAFALRPFGFIISTITFLLASGYVLGERKLKFMTFVATVATVSIWYLVQEVLGIFLVPLPAFLAF